MDTEVGDPGGVLEKGLTPAMYCLDSGSPETTAKDEETNEADGIPPAEEAEQQRLESTVAQPGTTLGGPLPVTGTTLGGTVLGGLPEQKPLAKRVKKPAVKKVDSQPQSPQTQRNVIKTHREVDMEMSSDEEEEEEEYKKGGYHPVKIGNVFKNRYKVQYKLGWGHFSTVWYCTDSRGGVPVALKIVKSARHYREAAQDEIHILQTLANADPQNKSCVLRLLDNFDVSGINGTHISMAFEILGCNLLSLTRMYNYRGLPIPLVRMLTKQMMIGVAFLHKCQVIHTDLKPENVLMVKTPKLLITEETKETEEKEPEKTPEEDAEGDMKKESPETEAKPRRKRRVPWAREELEETYAKDQSYKVKIVDLGNACWTFKHFTTDVQTREYRAPEVILGATYGPPIDVWSMACIVFELLTGDQLFKPKNGRSYDKNDDHLALILELMGRPRPEHIVGKHASEYFTRRGELRNIKSLKFWPLKDVFMQKYNMAEAEAVIIADFLTPMLTFNPKERVTAAKSILHPWIKDVDIDDFSTTFN